MNTKTIATIALATTGLVILAGSSCETDGCFRYSGCNRQGRYTQSREIYYDSPPTVIVAPSIRYPPRQIFGSPGFNNGVYGNYRSYRHYDRCGRKPDVSIRINVGKDHHKGKCGKHRR